MCIQNAIDTSAEEAIERGDFLAALRMRWLSNANDNAAIDTDDILIILQQYKHGSQEKYG